MLLSSHLLPPDFVPGHDLYVREVRAHVLPGCYWLDAGGGRKVFDDPRDGETELISRAARAVVVDADQASLDAHETIQERVCATLDSLPFPDASFDLITFGMVAEHLSEPAPVLRELARVLRPSGHLLVHTVNRWGYPTLLASASRLIPFRLRRRLISCVTGRQVTDIWPTYYRANTAAALSALAHEAGLRVERLEHWNSGILFWRVPVAAVLEALVIRFLSCRALAPCRAQLFAVLTRP